jgi:hypothetical protein
MTSYPIIERVLGVGHPPELRRDPNEPRQYCFGLEYALMPSGLATGFASMARSTAMERSSDPFRSAGCTSNIRATTGLPGFAADERESLRSGILVFGNDV